MKTAADYLKAMHWVHVRIDSKKERLAELQAEAEANGGIRYDKERVISSLPQEGGFEDKAVDVMMLVAEIQKDRAELAGMYAKGREIIKSLPNPIDQTIMDLFYIDHRKIHEIAAMMHYSDSNIYYRKKHAMDRLRRKSL